MNDLLSSLAPSDIWIAGPTAAGKSQVALILAEQLDGEIVSVDSMQVYQGLNVGTAKPSTAERRRVPHHLLDLVSLRQTFSVAQFLHAATAALHQIHRRGRIAILCGGTGLYFKALLEGLDPKPSPDPALRTALEQLPLSSLLEELALTDPQTFARIDRSNPRRVIRAVEVARLSGSTGLPQRSMRTLSPGWVGPGGYRIERRPEDLKRRIGARVEHMISQGLIEETKQLMQAGMESNRTAMQAIGYRQVVEYLHGQRNLQETISLIKQRTWQFARRQRNWFQRQLTTRPIQADPDEQPESIVQKLVKLQEPLLRQTETAKPFEPSAP